MEWTIGGALHRGQKMLGQTETPRLDAEVLLAFVLCRDRVYLYREHLAPLSREQAAAFEELLRRRNLGEPVAYLTGQREFMGLDFWVGPHVLIPRPETELMVETALELLQQWPVAAPAAVDVGTGSGAVAVSLAHYAPGVRLLATDISPQALQTARANAKRHGVQVSFYRGDLLHPLAGVLPPRTAALVTANLPYIPSPALPQLPREVRDFEPELALDGGSDGLALYRRLVPAAARLLAPGGHVLLEIAPDQYPAGLALLPPAHWQTQMRLDLAGRPRLLLGRRLP